MDAGDLDRARETYPPVNQDTRFGLFGSCAPVARSSNWHNANMRDGRLKVYLALFTSSKERLWMREGSWLEIGMKTSGIMDFHMKRGTDILELEQL